MLKSTQRKNVYIGITMLIHAPAFG